MRRANATSGGRGRCELHRRAFRRHPIDHGLQLAADFGHDRVAQFIASPRRAHRDCLAYLNYCVKRLMQRGFIREVLLQAFDRFDDPLGQVLRAQNVIARIVGDLLHVVSRRQIARTGARGLRA